MTHKFSVLSCLMLALALPAAAQLNSQVSVQGEYQPIVIDTERLSTLPQAVRFDLPPAALSYDFSGIVTDFGPSLLTMGTAPRLGVNPNGRYRGYVDFSMGSWLNTRLKAGYDAIRDSVNTLTASLDFFSTSLWRPKNVPESYTSPSRRQIHDGTLALDYSRLLGKEGLLKAAASYRLAYFNYYGSVLPKVYLPLGEQDFKAPSQTLNQASLSASYSSSPAFISGWHASLGADFTGYRRLYSPLNIGEASAGDKETMLSVGAGYAYAFSSKAGVAIDADGRFLFYGSSSPAALRLPDYSRSDYGVVSLRPAFRMETTDFRLNAGVDLALSYDAMGSRPGSRFGNFHVAPDVTLAYRFSKGVGISLSATGGVTPSTLLLREEFDRWQLPWALSTAPVYTPVDGRLAFGIGPFAGFSADLAVRYAVARNVPVGGWYQAFLGCYLSPQFPLYKPAVASGDAAVMNLRGASAEVDLRYAYGKMVQVEVSGSYSPQNGETGIFNGFDRPRWILDASATVSPIDRLHISLSYNYRGVRNCYGPVLEPDGATALRPYRLDDACLLGARVGFDVLRNLEVYVKGENLLNSPYSILPGLSSEGIVVSGGFTFEF